MSSEQLRRRIDRMYAALSGVTEHDLSKYPPEAVDSDGGTIYWLDFRRGLTDADLDNAVHSLIHNVAHLDNHLRKWIGRDEAKRTLIDSTLLEAREFRIVKDISNNDKHGYPRRGGGLSGVSPRLVNVNSVLQLRTGPRRGSSVGVVMGPTGLTQIGASDSSAQVVITGDVVDIDGDRVGDLHALVTAAVDTLEPLFRDLGVEFSALDDSSPHHKGD